MKTDNIVAVIDKLGEIIINNNINTSFLEYENEKLKKQLEEIEQYINYYEEQNITESDYKEAAHKDNVSYSK